MPGPFGLTVTGFVKKLFADVYNDVVAAVRAVPGLARVNLARETFFGGVLASCSAAVAEVWDVASEVYASWDPDAASGRSLDNLCALTGTVRQAATPTLVTCTVNVNVGLYPVGALVASPVGNPSVQYTNPTAAVNNGGGPADVTGVIFQCTTPGAIPCPAGTLTVLAGSYPGWNSVTNPADGTIGTDLETDAQLRARRVQELAAGGGSTADALVANALKLVGMVSAFVYDNDLDAPVTSPVALPAHSFMAVFYDGTVPPNPPNVTDAELAALVWSMKPEGVRTVGSTTATTPDKNGVLQTVSFSRPATVPVYLAVTVTAGDGWDPVATPAAIKAALAQYGQATYGPGATVVRSFLYAPITGIPGVGDVTALYLGLAANPVTTANLPMTALQKAAFDTTQILVNGS